MKRPRSHEIDELAQRIFRVALPPEWIPREQKPDYGIDYTVDVYEGGRPTGLPFGVQLKLSRRTQRWTRSKFGKD